MVLGQVVMYKHNSTSFESFHIEHVALVRCVFLKAAQILHQSKLSVNSASVYTLYL